MSEPPRARHFILGTAGHIDHGKTSLVRALTGVDTDRLPEEKRRGMTIELGFAELVIGDLHFGIVDVPGHERFVRTMVAGATGIDLALIVVAADDSVMPQTVEHVDILNLLGIGRAVVAVTKSDTVDEEMVELVTEDVRSLLDGTLLKDAPICPVSSTTGAGLDALKQAIEKESRDIVPTPAQPPFQMAIDRVFTVQGRGTVVTGSVLRGAVQAGEELEVWPAGKTCRARDLQAHGEHHGILMRGQRAAINVSGIDRASIQRGSELATPGYLQPSRIVGVRLQCLGSYAHSLKSTHVVRLEIGTTEVPVRVVFFDTPALEPGRSAYAQLRSGEPITCSYGQRFIIRDENATRSIGGGVVLQPVARRRHRDRSAELESLRRLDTGDIADRVEEVLRAAGLSKPTDLQLCARAGVELAEIPLLYEQLEASGRWMPINGTDTYAVPAALDDLTRRFVHRLDRYHREHSELPGWHSDAALGWLERLTGRTIARSLFESLLQRKTLKSFGQFICLPEFAPAMSAGDEKYLGAMVEEIRSGRFSPPALTGLTVLAKTDRKRLERLATLAVASGQLVKVDAKLYLHADVERELREVVAKLINDAGSVTVAELREAIDSSRKFTVPFLEYLDSVGFTKRIEDRRVLADAAS